MTDPAPRTSRVADTVGLLRAATAPRAGADVWDGLLEHVRGPRVRAARVTRWLGERLLVVGVHGDEAAFDEAAGVDGALHGVLDGAFDGATSTRWHLARSGTAEPQEVDTRGVDTPGTRTRETGTHGTRTHGAETSAPPTGASAGLDATDHDSSDDVVAHGNRLVVAIRERGAVVAGLEIALHERADPDDLREAVLFAAAAEARLTERSHRLETELVSRLAAANEVALDARHVAATALSLLVPLLGASTGALIAIGSVDTEVLAIQGYDPRVREQIMANRVPFGHGMVWRSCVDETPRLARDYGADPDRFEAVVEHLAPVVLTHPLMHLDRARHALMFSFEPANEPTHGDLQILAGIEPVLAGLLAASHDRERHDAMLDFQFRALTQQIDDLRQAVLALAIATVPGAECGSLLVRDPGGDTFSYRAVLGFDTGGTEPATFTADEMAAWYDPTGRVTEPREPRILTSRGIDLARHARETGTTRSWGRATEVGTILANLCVPIVENEQVVAYLNLDNRRWGRAFGADTVMVVERYALPTTALLLGALRHEQVHAEAMSDPLTGLLNRRGFELRAAEVLRDARGRGAPFNLLMMDLHGFKRVNDRFGHEAGDAALLRVANALMGQARRGDVLARWGGDEFVAVLPNVTAGDAESLVTRLQAAVHDLDPVDHELAIDIGAASYPRDGEAGSVLLQVADRRMYAAKRRRRYQRS